MQLSILDTMIDKLEQGFADMRPYAEGGCIRGERVFPYRQLMAFPDTKHYPLYLILATDLTIVVVAIVADTFSWNLFWVVFALSK